MPKPSLSLLNDAKQSSSNVSPSDCTNFSSRIYLSRIGHSPNPSVPRIFEPTNNSLRLAMPRSNKIYKNNHKPRQTYPDISEKVPNYTKALHHKDSEILQSMSSLPPANKVLLWQTVPYAVTIVLKHYYYVHRSDLYAKLLDNNP